MTTARPLSIGITIGLRSQDESLWTNGIKQNALFLAKLFANSPRGHRVVLANTTGVPISESLPWCLDQFPTVRLDDVCDDLDVVIELGGQVSPDQTIRIKKRGAKLVSYCCGPEYIQNIEAMIFRRRLWDEIFINEHYDELWIIPQILELNKGFLQTFRKCPAKAVPFVWDPMAIESLAASLPGAGEYRPRAGAKRLSVVEPNIDVLKFCLYPILIAEKAFRQGPASISYLHVANSDHMALDGNEFTKLMQRLDIVQASKASFIGRVVTPHFLAHHTDVVISHQWGLPLNYFYLECCWQGYPLVHNAQIVSELGYYYKDHDVDAGAQQLMHAMAHHDDHWAEYTLSQRDLISRFRATNPELVMQYDKLLDELVGT